jgi:hypothetical protein
LGPRQDCIQVDAQIVKESQVLFRKDFWYLTCADRYLVVLAVKDRRGSPQVNQLVVASVVKDYQQTNGNIVFGSLHNWLAEVDPNQGRGVSTRNAKSY